MFAALRAELLLIRKWPAAWGLLLVVPALSLIGTYLFELVLYLTVTPAQYAQYGTPAQLLPPLLPGQFVIVSVQMFTFSNVTPFVVLGAALAGGDWARGTIGTSLLARPGRIRSGAGQASALAVAVAVSVAATFAVSAAASLLIRVLEAKAVTEVDGAMPPAWVLVRTLGAAMLVALTYGAMGWFLGTACRSAAGGIAAALAWTVIIEPNISNLGLDTGGLLQKISDFLPGNNAVTVTSLFGTVGGGATSQNYLPTRPAIAAWALAGYTVAFVVLALVLLWRRDVLAGRVRCRWRRLSAQPARAAAAASARPRRVGGVLASARAELLVMRNRPVLWALVLAVPANMLIEGYLTDYVAYRTAGNGAPGTLNVSAPLMLPGFLPGQYLTAALSGLGTYSGLYGPAAFFLLGALVSGTDWGRGTIKTALLQGPGRLQARIGQDLAVMLAAVAGIVLTFALAAGTTAGLATALSGAAPPLDTRFPDAGHVAVTVTGALLVGLACTAIGLALGTMLRSATKAAAVVLLWTVLVQPYLDQIGPQLHGVLLRLYEILPDASINTVVNLYNPNTVVMAGTVAPPSGVQVAPALAFATLGLYILIFLAVPGLITSRRSIT